MSLGPGKRTKKRQAMNRRLKARHVENGWPQTCEVRLEGCLRSWALTWAHSRKSRFITTDEGWMEAALCCVSCHNKIEAMPHAKMNQIVLDAIAKRSKVETS